MATGVNTNIGDSVPNELAATAVKLPSFWTACPIAWFIQAEAQFNTKNIKQDITKFEYVVASLPQEIILSVLDIIQNPTQQNSYTILKQALIDRHSISEERKLEELLSEAELGDRKPSEFYRHLELLAGTLATVGSALLKRLWMRKLPPTINIALVASGKENKNELIDIADKIWNVSQAQQISSLHPKTTNNINIEDFITAFTSMSTKYESLQNEMKLLQNTIQNLSSIKRGRSSTSYSNDRRRNSRSSSRKRFNEKGAFCWYHFHFGENARKCIDPCTYKTNKVPPISNPTN